MITRALGRYLARDEQDVLARFPGIHAERTGARRGRLAWPDHMLVASRRSLGRGY